MVRRVSTKVLATVTNLQAGSIHCPILAHAAYTPIIFGWHSDTALHLSLKKGITRKWRIAACLLHGLDPNHFINHHILLVSLQLRIWFKALTDDNTHYFKELHTFTIWHSCRYGGRWMSKISRQLFIILQLSSDIKLRIIGNKIKPIPTSTRSFILVSDWVLTHIFCIKYSQEN